MDDPASGGGEDLVPGKISATNMAPNLPFPWICDLYWHLHCSYVVLFYFLYRCVTVLFAFQIIF
jgi:hypothetical protein